MYRPTEPIVQPYKREHPRVSVHLPVELRTPEGVPLHARTVNISRAGLQLSCDRHTFSRLFPGGLQPLPSQRVAVRVRLELPPQAPGPAALEASCNAVFSRRIAENDFRVGLQFTDLPEAGYERLERYIDSCAGGPSV